MKDDIIASLRLQVAELQHAACDAEGRMRLAQSAAVSASTVAAAALERLQLALGVVNAAREYVTYYVGQNDIRDAVAAYDAHVAKRAAA